MRSAIGLIVKRQPSRKMLFVFLGEGGPTERIDQTEIRFVPYQEDPKVVACYFQAADVYMRAARAETFPTAILESLACWKPVVATAVAGM